MPYTLADLPFFIVLPVLLAFSAFFSGSETALFGLSRHQRQQLARNKGITGLMIRTVMRDERVLLVELMLGNMTVNVLIFVVSSALLLKLDAEQVSPLWVAVLTIVPLLMVIVIGEVLPKLVANTARLAWVTTGALPLYLLHRLFSPIARAISRFIVQPLGRLVSPPRPAIALGADELATLLEMSQRRGVIGSDEQQLLKEVLDLSAVKVREIMTPRVDVIAIDVNQPPHALRAMIEQTRRPRYLAIDGDIDQVLGIIYARQFLLASRLEPNVSLRKLVRGVMFVPEIQRVDQLLEIFRKSGTKSAVAVDEYGGTAGIISLKDVVERLLGEMDMDEVPGETPESSLTQIDPRTWRASGRLSIHDWSQAFGAPNLPPRVATVGGLVMALLGHVPTPGEKVRLVNLEIEVEKVTGGRLDSVVLRLLDAPTAHAPHHPEASR